MKKVSRHLAPRMNMKMETPLGPIDLRTILGLMPMINYPLVRNEISCRIIFMYSGSVNDLAQEYVNVFSKHTLPLYMFYVFYYSSVMGLEEISFILFQCVNQ